MNPGRLHVVPLVVAFSLLSCLSPSTGAEATLKPNILWLTSEDIGPELGCYGDAYADTPHLDELASRGMIYLHTWSNAPVCAPARTTIISGVYPTSTGSQHMRSMAPMPEGMQMYPQYLREAGYYCTNNNKEDYNLTKPGEVWDASSKKAHWKNRRTGQPFFAIFNFTVTHESQIRRRPHDFVHDPADATLPAYHPDTLEVRQDWAQYYDNITTMDKQAGERLHELQEAGLADETIVFFYGDHGSGMPRSKRFPYNSGLEVALIVHVPEKFRGLAPQDYRPGGRTDRLVSFVDLAPTVLSLAGIEPPAYMQGRAFLGRYDAGPQPYLFGFRGRMDERYDMIRSASDGRYVYLRNYMPHLPYGQHVRYMFQTPTTRVWRQLYDAGKLTAEQSHFWQPKPAEELYDLDNDPDEVHNLADSPQHREILDRLRTAHREHCLAIRDLGFLPEPEIHSRSQGTTPYAIGHDPQSYPLERIMAVADSATSRDPAALVDLKKATSDKDSAVRYWAALGMLIRGRDAVASARPQLRQCLADPAPAVRIAAAWALGRHGPADDLDMALPVLLELSDYREHGVYVALMALNAIDDLDQKALPILDDLQALPMNVSREFQRMGYGVSPLMEKILADLKKE